MEASSKPLHCVTRAWYSVTEIRRGCATQLKDGILTMRKGLEEEAAAQPLVTGVTLSILSPDQHHTWSDTIMDVQPIGVKQGDALPGEGVTRVLDGVVLVLTGTDENQVQIGEFGSSDGYLDACVQFGRPGAPDPEDLLLMVKVTIRAGHNLERPGPTAAHQAAEHIARELRQALADTDDAPARLETLEHIRRPGLKKVAVVKEVMGQGAMHDNLILPTQPAGMLGGRSNIDLGNVPIVLSPTEFLDGGIHALTCVGPASKETTRHYFREPLVLELLRDPEVDFCCVIVVGSPQINSEKYYVSRRLGMACEAMDLDGAIISTEGFGNNHIDFASHMEQLGIRQIPAVGVSFCGNQGALVVGNPHMTHLVDTNKSPEGVENEVLACNTLCREDALRAFAMLKLRLAGGQAEPARAGRWSPRTREENMSLLKQEGIQ